MNLEALKSFVVPPVEHAYTKRDVMLYALGLGYGSDPFNVSDLKFVYEQGATSLKAVPSISVVLSHPGFWVREPSLELDWVKILHGEQSFQLHKPLAAEGRVRGEYEVIAVEDKGADKGAILYQDKRLYDVATNELLATVRSTLFMRGDGGMGGFGEVPPAPKALPDRAPDKACTLTTLPQSALIYRLSGDYNPIHADPEAAKRAGLGQPILHGLCTMGIATRAAIDTLCDGEPERLRSLSVRFSRPVLPGETIVTEFFEDGPSVRFRARVLERDVVVLDRGELTLA